MRESNRTILHRHGYRVIEAQSGPDALAKLTDRTLDEPIHLLLTDLVMPRMSGSELEERLAPIVPGLRVLFVSGYSDDPVMGRDSLAQGRGVLHKPITPEALLRRVREVLEAQMG